jgi:hypothetical protein
MGSAERNDEDDEAGAFSAIVWSSRLLMPAKSVANHQYRALRDSKSVTVMILERASSVGRYNREHARYHLVYLLLCNTPVRAMSGP